MPASLEGTLEKRYGPTWRTPAYLDKGADTGERQGGRAGPGQSLRLAASPRRPHLLAYGRAWGAHAWAGLGEAA